MNYASHIFNSNLTGEEKERGILKVFLENISIEDISMEDIEIIKSECPDFIINTNKEKLGLEITEYYADSKSKRSSGKKRFEQWRQFADKFSTILLEKKLFYYGAIHFKQSKESEFFKSKFI